MELVYISVMNCYGCKSSSTSSKGSLRLAQKVKDLEPSGVDQCIKCVVDPCDGTSSTTICSNTTSVSGDLTVKGEINGTLCGTVIGTVEGNLCAGIIKSSIQLLMPTANADDMEITATDMITQIRNPDDYSSVTAYLADGSEGQIKYVHYLSGTNTISLDYGSGTLVLGDTTADLATSVMFYYISGAWYVLSTQNVS